jgi:hypothetical protein
LKNIEVLSSALLDIYIFLIIMKAKEALIQESITLPLEIRDRRIASIQISFLFEDGTMHHVKPDVASKKLARDCLCDNPIHYDNWEFLNAEDTEV